jgi:alanine dehydrogenase
VSVPFFAGANVYAALDPADALQAVRTAFEEHARGTWFMPSKVYVPAPPDGDFRAMPASGGGYAVLKWVTSFPRNPERGLPTVAGVVLLSDAGTGELLALLDAGAVTALRTGAAAVLAAEVLATDHDGPAAVIGSGVNGRAVARTFAARGRSLLLWDARPGQAEALAEEIGATVAQTREEALAAGVVATVTPGAEIVFPEGALSPRQHVSLMGADGPGKAEIAVEELLRVRVVCDEWEQGRRTADEITIFDSTGLAVQDLAVAVAVYEGWRANRRAEEFVGVTEIAI